MGTSRDWVTRHGKHAHQSRDSASAPVALARLSGRLHLNKVMNGRR